MTPRGRGAPGRAFPVAELFGFPIEDADEVARHFRENRLCPFINAPCLKVSEGIRLGTCSVYHAEDAPIIICPKRFWEGEELPALIARDADPRGGLLVVPEVGVGPLGRLDWALARLDASGEPVGHIYGVEAQAVDTTGSLRPYVEAYFAGDDWRLLDHPFGINWRNVWKRIVPQILAKGRLFEAQHSRLYVLFQDVLLDYLAEEIRLESARPGEDPNVVFYPFVLTPLSPNGFELRLRKPFGTTLRGIERAVGDVSGLPSRDDLARSVKQRVRALGLRPAPGATAARAETD